MYLADVYTDAFLGKSAEQYCADIMDPNAWGGAIELSIFADHYKAEIVAIDIKSCKPYVYGEGRGFSTRVFALYSGIHYDAVALSPFEGAPDALDHMIFSTNDDISFAKALQLAAALKKARFSVSFCLVHF